MKIIGLIAVYVLIICAVVALGWGTSWFGLVTTRPMAKYAEETRRETYDTSRSYYQGTTSTLRRVCTQWRNATGGERDAAAELFRSTYDTYTGPALPADVLDCQGAIH